MTGHGAMSDGVLDGIKVVEFAQNVAVPHCGRMLAGMGADVVKVEPPGGDAMRTLAPVGSEGRGYVVMNPGKRSIAVDLSSPEAATVVDNLLAWADVVLVAFKLPDLERFGLDWEHAQTVNPRLVYLVHTALGPEGPDADQGGYDVLVQGRSGIGWIMNRSGGSAPQPTRPAVSDLGSGFVSTFAVLAGLRHLDQTGEGQRIDTSLLGTAMSLGSPMLATFAPDAEPLAELDEEIGLLRSAGMDFDAQRAQYDERVSPSGGGISAVLPALPDCRQFDLGCRSFTRPVCKVSRGHRCCPAHDGERQGSCVSRHGRRGRRRLSDPHHERVGAGVASRGVPLRPIQHAA